MQRVVDITDLAVLGEQFQPRLMQLGFHLYQVVDATGRDRFRFIVPPICEVPAGPFLMGSEKQRDPRSQPNERPEQMVDIASFQIGRYPVTVAEYGCAVEAGAVAAPQTNAGVTWQGQQHHPEHPVVCLTWRLAYSYVMWLASMTGQPWRLPSEAEWEKAARSTDGRIFPWGDGWEVMRANTREDGPGMTTPIGSYPLGVSPYGAYDMAGNVWEWTSSIYQETYGNLIDAEVETDAARVLRGGAWNVDLYNARVALRNWRTPDYFYVFYGMRLALGMSSEKMG